MHTMKTKNQHPWFALALLAIAQFIMVLDGTVMNVSISQVVLDIGSTVAGLQMAVTFFTLTMAACMLLGSKLGGRFGFLPAFTVGLAIYGLGSFITAISQNLPTLMLGWSFIEGIGAVLVIPAIIGIIATTYEGKERAIAFSVIGAVSGVAAALGPLIGGVMTTFFSWRYVFFAETAAVVGLLFLVRTLPSESTARAVPIDFKSVCYSIAGMGLVVFGLLQGKVWGWITPLQIPEVFGMPLAPLGISIVTYCLFGGLYLLVLFYQRQTKLMRLGKEPFLDVTLFRVSALRGGLSILLFQQISVAAIFFVIPIYLQIILGYNALQTGLKIIPLSVGVILFSILGTKLLSRYTVRTVIFCGQGGMILGTILILSALSLAFQPFLFGVGMFMIGAGLGFLSSQLSNVLMSSVPKENSDTVGGLQGSFQNLGSSLGTAIIGSILLVSLTQSFVSDIAAADDVPESIKLYVATQQNGAAPIVSGAQVEQYARAQGIEQGDAKRISDIYVDAQMNGLERALVWLVGISILGLFFTRRMPQTIP
jgi:MFS family permease